MIFPFRPYAVEPSSAYPFDVIYRLVIPIRIGVGAGRRMPFLGLADTGADDSKLTIPQAERLGVELDRSRPLPFRSATGWAAGFYGEITFELRQSPTSYVWRAQVVVLPDGGGPIEEDHARVVLGHTSFFRFSSVAFDFQRRRLKLRPNRLFVGLPR